MAVTDTDGHDSTDAIKISTPTFVVEVLHGSFDDHYRFFIECEQSGGQVGFSHLLYFFVGWPSIGFGLMIERR